jgi:hypothetical protein
MRGLLLGALALVLVNGFTSVAVADHLEDYGAPVSKPWIQQLDQWARKLPSIGKLGQAYVLCAVRPHASHQRFNADFEACWSGADPTRSCAYRCNAEAKVYGYYAPSEMGPGTIHHVIFCRCENIVHDFYKYPVPPMVERN